jgi:hypothetical protein
LLDGRALPDGWALRDRWGLLTAGLSADRPDPAESRSLDPADLPDSVNAGSPRANLA